MADFYQILSRRYWGAPLRSWLMAIVLAFGVFFVLLFTRRFLLRRAKGWSRGSASHIGRLPIPAAGKLAPAILRGARIVGRV